MITLSFRQPVEVISPSRSGAKARGRALRRIGKRRAIELSDGRSLLPAKQFTTSTSPPTPVDPGPLAVEVAQGVNVITGLVETPSLAVARDTQAARNAEIALSLGKLEAVPETAPSAPAIPTFGKANEKAKKKAKKKAK